MADRALLDVEEPSTRRPLDLVFVVDCSGSMAGDRIAALNWAIRSVVPTIRAHAEEFPNVAVHVRVLRFATGAAFATAYPEPIDRFAWTNLVASGESDMGTALRLLADALGEYADKEEGALPPVLVLFSDGFPSDDADGGLEALLGTELGRRAIRVPIAIGQDADMALLRRFSSDATLAPLRTHDVDRLIGRMRWVAAVPVVKGLEQSQSPGQGIKAAESKPSEDEDLW